MDKNTAVSVIVPALNEAANVAPLLQRIDAALSDMIYEVVIVDDYSTDNTAQLARDLSTTYPVRVVAKQGEPGKAQALLEGFDAAQYDLLCMIDADLQYPPEAIAPMVRLLQDKRADVVVTDREENDTSLMRKITTRGFNLVFARLLFGISYDTQSGLKVFRKAVLQDFDMKPSPWSFDLEFLVRSLENKRKILSFTIPFSSRMAGVTKVKVFHVAYELAKASLALRYRTSISKVRAGHKQNSRFIRKAFPTSLLLLVSLVAALSLSPVRSASADPLISDTTVQPITANLGQTLTDVLSVIPAVTSSLSDVATSQPVGTTSSTISTVQPSNASTTTPASTTDITTSNAGNLTSSLIVRPTGTSSSSSSTVSSVFDRSGLSAATSTADNSSPYNSIPFSPSSRIKRGISIIATAFLTAGLVCLVAVLIISGFKAAASRRRLRNRWAAN